jgi:hypothetical protein
VARQANTFQPTISNVLDVLAEQVSIQQLSCPDLWILRLDPKEPLLAGKGCGREIWSKQVGGQLHLEGVLGSDGFDGTC